MLKTSILKIMDSKDDETTLKCMKDTAVGAYNSYWWFLILVLSWLLFQFSGNDLSLRAHICLQPSPSSRHNAGEHSGNSFNQASEPRDCEVCFRQGTWCDSDNHVSQRVNQLPTSLPGAFVYVEPKRAEPCWHNTVVQNVYLNGSTASWSHKEPTVSRLARH